MCGSDQCGLTIKIQGESGMRMRFQTGESQRAEEKLNKRMRRIKEPSEWCDISDFKFLIFVF